MRDRIEAAGGRFEIISAPGNGTSIRATIPGDGPPPPTARHEAQQQQRPQPTSSGRGDDPASKV
jgi:hypothetical protein